MLIFKKKELVKIQEAVDSGIRYIAARADNCHIDDRPALVRKRREWGVLLNSIVEFNLDPRETYVYTIADHDSCTDDLAETWASVYTGLGKAKVEVLQDVCYRRGQREESITVLPVFEDTLTGHVLRDTLTGRTYEITRATLK
jgi:hypothetical protein